MPKKNGRLGGFAAQNSGKIENCYSVVQMDTKGCTAGGFAGENTGAISKSYSHCKIKGLTGGFSGDGGGNTEQSCYFFHEEKEGSKKLEKLCDPIRGQRLKELSTDEDAENLGFDLKTIWERNDGKAPLRFVPDNWLYNVEQSKGFGRYLTEAPDGPNKPDGADGAHTEVQVTVIATADELWELARQINEGNRALAAAYIRLEDDISLGGKEWIPIGRDRTCAFTGIFDGGGHTVKNFVIKDKKTENKGFFGFLKGAEIYNLSVDCHMKGGTCSGGIAAQNEDGIIGCCAAVIEVAGKNGSFGGLVGRNTGAIFESYTAGRIFFILIPFWWGLPLLGLLLLLILLRVPGLLPTFAPVPYDTDSDGQATVNLFLTGDPLGQETQQYSQIGSIKTEITPLHAGTENSEPVPPGASDILPPPVSDLPLPEPPAVEKPAEKPVKPVQPEPPAPVPEPPAESEQPPPAVVQPPETEKPGQETAPDNPPPPEQNSKEETQTAPHAESGAPPQEEPQ